MTVIGFHAFHEQVHPTALLDAVIRALLTGQEVSRNGLMRVGRARVWTLPDIIPPLIGGPLTEKTAGCVAGWADGLVTVNQPAHVLARVLVAYRENGGEGTAALQIHVSWAPSEEQALRIAHDQWRSNIFGPPISWTLDSPEAFDAASRQVPPEAVFVSSDLAKHAAYLRECADLGFDQLCIHHVSKERGAFTDAFGTHLLPQVAEPARNEPSRKERA